VKCTGQWWEIE